ncbi:ribosomal protein L10-domain-containing protein [Auriculariales sp. MPI-PUGE-AT-0066]|nr:ribosomal protein L10-domain-containing protein [Auriculariales sp. MPI-PUGE-AT-0066]
MPRSKKAKVVSLTKVAKKTKENKTQHLEAVQESADKWKYCYVIEIADMRGAHLKDVRQKWSNTGRVFFARNSIISKAFGSTPEEEHKLGLAQLNAYLNGQVGVFFTDHDPKETEAWFEHYQQPVFARAGNKATKTVTLEAGPILSRHSDPPEPFQHTMEPQLRKLGLTTKLVRGVPSLDVPHVVCKEGDTLTAEQAQILKLIGERLATFKVTLLARWTADAGTVVKLAEPAASIPCAPRTVSDGNNEEVDEDMDG